MNVYEGLYRSIKEAIPVKLKITFNNLDENNENCAMYFKGSVSNPDRDLSGNLMNRQVKLIFNYVIKDTFEGYDYGEAIVKALNKFRNILYKDAETGEKIVYISDIRLLGNINYLGKNRNNSLNCFSINFIVTYGKL